MTCTVDISVLDERWEDAIAKIDALTEETVSLALEEAGLSQRFKNVPVEVSIVFANDAVVQDLNKRYRGQDKPTNVLSFSQLEGPQTLHASPLATLGDIALAYETIMREAAEQKKSIEDHTRHLLVHGALHLLGFDHENDNEAEEMEALEAQILSHFGIKNPYEMGKAMP